MQRRLFWPISVVLLPLSLPFAPPFAAAAAAQGGEREGEEEEEWTDDVKRRYFFSVIFRTAELERSGQVKRKKEATQYRISILDWEAGKRQICGAACGDDEQTFWVLLQLHVQLACPCVILARAKLQAGGLLSYQD